jgi:hypothetical protein
MALMLLLGLLGLLGGRCYCYSPLPVQPEGLADGSVA